MVICLYFSQKVKNIYTLQSPERRKKMDIVEIWKKTLDSLRDSVDSQLGYDIHTKNAVPVSFENSVFIITVPRSINRNMIEFRYKKFIEAALERITGSVCSLKIYVDGENYEEIKREELPPENSPSFTLSTEPDTVNPKYTFENFVIGSSNQYATAAAQKTAENPGYAYNPLFLYGNSGLGKTHLMQAIGNKIKQNNPNFNVIYVSSERFTTEFINCVRDGKMAQFKNKYRSADVLLIDDVQFFAKTQETQEEFFHTFNELYSLNKQIVITSDRKPVDLITLEERLRTRFSQGLTIDITIPNFETRVAILKKKADSHNAYIDENVLEYIANRIKSNIRELEGALLKIISMSEISHQKITIDTANEILEKILPSDGIVKITPEKVIEKVSVFYNIPKEEITGKNRTKHIATARQIAMYLCSKYTDLTPASIGEKIGKKERTTVMHNVNKIENELKTNELLKSDIEYITKDLQSI